MIAYEIARESVKKHEGLRLQLYKDTVGKWTIGYGHNIEDRGISLDVAEAILDEDMSIALRDAREVFGEIKFASLSEERQAVWIELSFQLGRTRLSGFIKALSYSRLGQHELCAKELLSSRWAKQVPGRAKELTDRYLLG